MLSYASFKPSSVIIVDSTENDEKYLARGCIYKQRMGEADTNMYYH